MPALLICCVGMASAQDAPHQAGPAFAGPMLTATTLSELQSADARQGAAADGEAVYAIGNFAIARIGKADGAPLARWEHDPADGGQIAHLNSCFVDGAAEGGRLLCANSNYPNVPMASSVEVFDIATMRPAASHSLGLMDEGSLTWFARGEGGWIAGFAHYDERGGLEYKDHRFASIVLFDSEWRRRGGWVLPASVIERMAPYAASGGALGPDGYLYVTGHDLPEMYVLAKPKAGPALTHVATVAVRAEGQAFAWDPEAFERGGRRIAWGIGREGGRIFQMQIPEIPAPPENAELFAR